MKYIYQNERYPDFVWDKDAVLNILTRIAALQGNMLGKMQQFGFGVQKEAMLNALTEEITKSSEIEGEILNSEQVRSSLARQLNINLKTPAKQSHYIDGIVETMMDAVNNFNAPLTRERLFGWHASLFPTGYSGMHKINVAKYRTEEMQVISNKGYRTIVHYTAPKAGDVPREMADYLVWLNAKDNENALLKAAIAHLWFVIIHPFDDGNGRLTRIITEMLIARAENTNLRFYSMSAQIQKEKKGYYDVLEKTTTGTLDITAWFNWFFACLARSIENSSNITGKVIKKAAFWQKNSVKIPDETQRAIINRLFDGLEGNMTTGKAAKLFKVSQDTAARLMKDLADKGFLELRGAGRATHYVLPESVS